MKRVVLTIAIICLVPACGPGESVYHGKRGTHWLEEMSHKDSSARMRAALALGRIEPKVKGSIPALRKALKDHDPLVRWAAAEALGSFGPRAKSAVPELREIAKSDESQAAQEAAKESLKHIELEVAP